MPHIYTLYRQSNQVIIQVKREISLLLLKRGRFFIQRLLVYYIQLFMAFMASSSTRQVVHVAGHVDHLLTCIFF